jgi:hypothetical protein
VEARRRFAGGGLSAVQILSAAGQTAQSEHDVAVGAGGDAAAAWARFDGTDPPVCCDRIQATFGP